MADPVPAAEIAVVGGSGFYSYLADPVEVHPATPWGPPSGPVTIGDIGGRRVAFLPRHGPSHSLPPHRINHRANLWALRDLGVRRIVAPCAVGSLQPTVQPGDFVVLDQLIDRTSGRADTYLDGPDVDHVAFADPYCPELSAVLATAVLDRTGLDDTVTIHPTGTVVVIQGPRFSTRAESRWFRSAGWHVVNMTQYPEAYLARELGICYAGLALVTDNDSGEEAPGAVTMGAVMQMLAENVERTRRLLAGAIPRIPTTATCRCADSGARSLRTGGSDW